MAETEPQVVRMVDLDALCNRPLKVVLVPDAFDERGGCWVREFTAAEWQQWQDYATEDLEDGKRRLDFQKLQTMELAYCLLGGTADQPGDPLFGNANGHPTVDQLALLSRAIPVGCRQRLGNIIDALAGFRNAEHALLKNYPTPGQTASSGAVIGSGDTRSKSGSPSAASGSATSPTSS